MMQSGPGALDFVRRGGQALQGYPQYSRVGEAEGKHRVPDSRKARKYHMTIGTIGGNATM